MNNSIFNRGINTLSHNIIKRAVMVMSLTLLCGTTHAETVESSYWTGLYGGLNVGGIFNRADIDSNNLGFTRPDGTCDINANFSSFFPGVQVGYGMELSDNIVVGLEGDFTFNINNSEKVKCVCDIYPGVSDQFTVKNKLQGSVRGRIGYELGYNLLPFFTVGASLADVALTYDNENGDHYFKHSTPGGWLVGGGIDWGLMADWSLRAEYYYVSYGNTLNMAIPTIYGLNDPHGEAHVDLKANNVRVAINYWF